MEKSLNYYGKKCTHVVADADMHFISLPQGLVLFDILNVWHKRQFEHFE